MEENGSEKTFSQIIKINVTNDIIHVTNNIQITSFGIKQGNDIHVDT